jgi:hypothetical protein
MKGDVTGLIYMQNNLPFITAEIEKSFMETGGLF